MRLAALASALLAGCSDESKKAAAPAAPPPSVTVAKVTSQEIRQSAQFVGQIAAIAAVRDVVQHAASALGLDIQAETPAEIGIAIAAELVQLRRSKRAS